MVLNFVEVRVISCMFVCVCACVCAKPCVFGCASGRKYGVGVCRSCAVTPRASQSFLHESLRDCTIGETLREFRELPLCAGWHVEGGYLHYTSVWRQCVCLHLQVATGDQHFVCKLTSQRATRSAATPLRVHHSAGASSRSSLLRCGVFSTPSSHPLWFPQRT